MPHVSDPTSPRFLTPCFRCCHVISCDKNYDVRTLREIQLAVWDRQAIEEAVTLLKRNFPVTEVRLFGSKARGDSDPESDIDLLVLVSRRLSWRERNTVIDVLFDTQLKYGVTISPLVVTVDEWHTGSIAVLHIHDEIEEEGIAA